MAKKTRTFMIELQLWNKFKKLARVQHDMTASAFLREIIRDALNNQDTKNAPN